MNGIDADNDERMTISGDGLVTSGEFSPALYQRAMILHCRRCNRRPELVLEDDLRRLLLAGCREIHIGANGEVRPVGQPRARI